jgi:exopolysaccharide biosynthesis polyprenyl glycosylphosphotransferase
MGTRFLEKIITFFFDVIAINVAFAATFWLRYKSNLFPETFNPNFLFADWIQLSLLVAALWIVLFFFTGLYRDWYKESRVDEFLVVSRTVFVGIFILYLLISADSIINFLLHKHQLVLMTRTRFVFLSTYGVSMLVFSTLNRFCMHTFLTWLFIKGIAVKNVIIIGTAESGEKLSKEILHYPQLGYKIIGFVDDDGRKKGKKCNGLPVFGTYSDLPDAIIKHNVGGLIISYVSTSPNEILRILNYSADSNVTIYMVPTLMDVISGHLKTHQVFGVPLIVLLHDHMPSWQAQVKRIFDIVASILILVLGSPIWLLTGLLVRLTSPGTVFFKQERIGQNGKPFTMIKFRSMYEDAEKRSGPKWATEDDPRITQFGHFMRNTRLDEIPQLINVVKGEMSFVGPRPERAYFIEKLTEEIPWYVRRIKMKPGITGWAQVKHKYDATIEDVKQKVIFDLYYFENMSLLLDLKILLRTILVVLTGRGAR